MFVVIAAFVWGCVGPVEQDTSPSVLPDGLVDRTWVTQRFDGSYVVGMLAGSERLVVPAGRVPIAVGQGVVAALTTDVGANRSAVEFFALGSPPVAPVTVPFIATTGAFAGSELVVAGWTSDGSTDAGVVAIDSSSGRTRYLLPPGPAPTDGFDPVRFGYGTSSSGSVVLCRYGSGRCRATVIRLPSGQEMGSVDVPGFVRLASDRTVILGGDPASWISAIDVTSGDLRWTRKADEFGAGYLVGDSALVQEQIVDEARSLEIVRIDLATGDTDVLFTMSGNENLRLWPELSNGRVAVLGPGHSLQLAGAQAEKVTLTILDLETGAVDRNLFTLILYDEQRRYADAASGSLRPSLSFWRSFSPPHQLPVIAQRRAVPVAPFRLTKRSTTGSGDPIPLG